MLYHCNQLASNWTTNQFVQQLDFDSAQHWSIRTDVFVKLSSWQMVTTDWLVEKVLGDIHGTTKSMTLCNERFQVLRSSQLENHWVWKTPRWHHNGSMTKRSLPGMGRHMPRYICSIPLASLEHCSWCSSSRGRNQKENQICRFATPHRCYTNRYRNNGCLGE